MASLSLYSQFETNLLSNRKVIELPLQFKSAKAHGKNHIKVKPHVVCHLLRNCLLSRCRQMMSIFRKNNEWLRFRHVFLSHCNLKTLYSNATVCIYYLLTGCKGRTRKYKPKVFHTARACEGCLENQGLVFPGTARAPS